MTPTVMEQATTAPVASAANGAVAPAGVPGGARPLTVEAKLERVLALLEAQEERRQDLEEIVGDMLPAVNGAIRLAIGKLDSLEKSGALELLPLAGAMAGAMKRPSEIRPVGPIQLLRALRDPDVARGVGVMLELLRAIGSASAGPGAASSS